MGIHPARDHHWGSVCPNVGNCSLACPVCSETAVEPELEILGHDCISFAVCLQGVGVGVG